jgi:trans-o-hydroxybenzylidenepyruvate hydratase-aldolase
MMSSKDIRGMYAIIPTPATENASRVDAANTVDLEETERAINQLIKDGSSGLIMLGTTGECATLSQVDYEVFVRCAVDVVARRVPLIVGTTALGGHEVARRLRMCRDLRVDGSLLGLPMWQPATLEMAVRFYSSVSDAFPDLPIMVYANARAFRFNFSFEFWQRVSAAAPTVISAKYSKTDGLAKLIAATGNRINFVPNEMVVHQFYDASPETTSACWATAAAMNPLPAIELMRAISDRSQSGIKNLAAAIAWANEPILPIVENPDLFAQFNIQVEKVRINSAGYMKSGPVRPPYDLFPLKYETKARECGLRWRAITEAYRGDFIFEPGPWDGSNRPSA